MLHSVFVIIFVLQTLSLSTFWILRNRDEESFEQKRFSKEIGTSIVMIRSMQVKTEMSQYLSLDYKTPAK